LRPTPTPTLFPYTTLFRSQHRNGQQVEHGVCGQDDDGADADKWQRDAKYEKDDSAHEEIARGIGIGIAQALLLCHRATAGNQGSGNASEDGKDDGGATGDKV